MEIKIIFSSKRFYSLRKIEYSLNTCTLNSLGVKLYKNSKPVISETVLTKINGSGDFNKILQTIVLEVVKYAVYRRAAAFHLSVNVTK